MVVLTTANHSSPVEIYPFCIYHYQQYKHTNFHHWSDHNYQNGHVIVNAVYQSTLSRFRSKPHSAMNQSYSAVRAFMQQQRGASIKSVVSSVFRNNIMSAMYVIHFSYTVINHNCVVGNRIVWVDPPLNGGVRLFLIM